MKPEKKDKHFIKKAFYEGGMKAIRNFISKELKYPKEALAAKIEGTVFIKYTIGHKGKVIDTKVVSSLGYGCDEEAERLVKLLKFKVPKNRGVRIKFHKSIQIHFNLPKENSASAKIQYNYTSSTKPKDVPSQSHSYTYKININKS